MLARVLEHPLSSVHLGENSAQTTSDGQWQTSFDDERTARHIVAQHARFEAAASLRNATDGRDG
jgi:hypothetical protein